MTSFDYDIGIIGGGPAGSATAAYLAKAGLSCAIFERDIFPRPHVGESLVPSSTRAFKDLGFLEKMDAADFPRKYRAAWTSSGQARSIQNTLKDWNPIAMLASALRNDSNQGLIATRPST